MSRPDAFLMLAPYPSRGGLEDAAAEAEMAPVIAAIEGLRNIRGESNLPPLQRIRAVVQTDDAALRAALERHRGDLESLAGLSEMMVQPTGAPPPSSASWVGQGVSTFRWPACWISTKNARACGKRSRASSLIWQP